MITQKIQYKNGKVLKERDVITFEDECGFRITGIVTKKLNRFMVNTGDLYLVDINSDTDNIIKLGRISWFNKFKIF